MEQVPHGIWASCTVCLPVTTEAGHLVSKTLPPKINLHEGREKEGERQRGRREGGGKEIAWLSVERGHERERLRFN